MCKMAHFGNCDPETADQEYCIFHKPNKDEKEAREFYQKFLGRFRPRVEEIEVKGKKVKRLVFEEPVDAKGFVFPEIPDVPVKYIDEEGNEWNQKFTFENTVFKNYVNFSHVTFEGWISFKKSIFNSSVIFNKTCFKADVEFKASIFNSKFKLDQTQKLLLSNHPELAVWTMNISLEDLKIDTGNTVVLFIETQFHGKAIFCETAFNVEVVFFKTIFKDDAIFCCANFDHVKFEKITFLSGAHFNFVEMNNGNFEYCQFGTEKTPTIIFFWNSIFREVKFVECIFVGITLFNNSVFDSAKFLNLVFTSPLEFTRSIKEYLQGYDLVDNLILCGDTLKEVLENFDKRKDIENLYESQKTLIMLYDTCVFFRNAKFTKALFYNVIFNTGIDFTGIKCQDFLVNKCKFSEQIQFSNAQFTKKVEITNSIFNSNVSVNRTEFKEVSFNFAIFKEGANFKGTIFHGTTHFKGIEFKKEVNFSLATFKGKTSFDGSIFERLAVFVEQENTDTNEPTPKFHDELSFANCDFRQGADFLGSLKHETNLSKLWEFFSSRFSNSQAMIEALRVQRLSFEKEGKRDEADRMFVLEMRARRRLRLEQAKDDLWNSTRAKTRNFFEWLLGDLPSEYGTNWQKILKTSILAVLLFGFIYWVTLLNPDAGAVLTLFLTSIGFSRWYFQTFDRPELKKVSALVAVLIWLALIVMYFYFPLSTEKILKAPNILDSNGQSLIPERYNLTWETTIGTLLNALYYSLVTFTTLGYGDMHPTGWLKALSALEALTGAVFMALIVAVIARKWMR